MNLSDILRVEDFFERKFSFCREKDWCLPEIEKIHLEDTWYIDCFQTLKKVLNDAKSSLNDKGEHWQEHTFYTNKARLVLPTLKKKIHADLMTQAWCKFYEILSGYKFVIDEALSYKSLHLCEAPGAFISALNYYLSVYHCNISWKWYANSLNPYYEGQNVKNVIVDDRFLQPTLKHWYFGEDNTGDITDPSFLMNLNSFLNESGPFDLVTADGSINCIDNPAEQESVVSNLQFHEMLVALSCLADDATFVIKKFTFFESITICKMYLLNCAFRKVHVFKPFTSKAGNSEVYVICLGYLGIKKLNMHLKQLEKTYSPEQNKAMFPLSSLPSSFLKQLLQCAETFAELQKEAILENITLYSTELSVFQHNLETFQKLAANMYLRKYNICSDIIPKSMTCHKKQVLTSLNGRKYGSCKKQYFLAVGETFDNLMKCKSLAWSDVLLDVEKRLNSCFTKNKKRSHDEIEWCFVWNEVYNRMKTKDYKKWILTGKKIQLIQNSKFCNPLLLHLWNRISYANQVQIENHYPRLQCYWDMQAITSLLTEDMDARNMWLLSLSQLGYDYNTDPLYKELKETFHESLEIYTSDIQSKKTEISCENKVVYINSLCFVKNLNPELQIKSCLTDCLLQLLQLLQDGDSVLLCLQSLLTRYTVGILYLLISLFEKFVCILPSSIAPAANGQLWLLKNYQRQTFYDKIKEYLEYIKTMDVPDDFEVLEIVPIAALCGKFYEYLLPINNDYMIQRILSLTSVEKVLLENSI